MIDFIEKRHQELVAGLAELLLSKEDIEKKIEAQKVAINECGLMMTEFKKEN